MCVEVEGRGWMSDHEVKHYATVSGQGWLTEKNDVMETEDLDHQMCGARDSRKRKQLQPEYDV